MQSPNIIKRRNLVSVDGMMKGDFSINYYNESLCIPAASIDECLRSIGDGPTFAVIREMFAQDCYLRPFQGQSAKIVFDLGSNRGFFMLIANKVLKADLVIGVEPQAIYAEPFDIICTRNHMDQHHVRRYQAFIGAEPDDATVTIPQIMAENEVSTINFLKCDVEGAEFAVFEASSDWLEHVENIAMEVHPMEGDVARLAQRLHDSGMEVIVADQFGKPIADAQQAHYIYASQTGFRLG